MPVDQTWLRPIRPPRQILPAFRPYLEQVGEAFVPVRTQNHESIGATTLVATMDFFGILQTYANAPGLKLEHDSAKVTEAVLIVGTGQRVTIAGQHIVELYRPDGNPVGN